MGFGQLVIGAPGSGKTTYCHGISQVSAARPLACSRALQRGARTQLGGRCELY